MISLLNDYNNCANTVDAAIAPPHAAELPITVPSIDALSDRHRFCLSRIGAFHQERMIVRVGTGIASVIDCRPLYSLLQNYVLSRRDCRPASRIQLGLYPERHQRVLKL
ncbi:hypothetical protein [Caballeronia sp. ATUFL_F1_KS4A]|uniref:hypothetical protein n=1 Tax=Caballeronia sp. ATUFL_F1_KS4A TaxID=2921768 RepID=UPI00202836F5|nr:hypothetical protein [Caballeronia sp. ATUFL_F1_KS4A]